MELGTQVCGDLAAGAVREWLVADGIGGYAMGTVSGLRTRRYHGLLVLANSTPAQRTMALAALDPIVTMRSGAQVRLGTHEWASGAIAPHGYAHLERFDLVDGVPRWRWRIGDVVLERELAMRPASVAVVHRLLAGAGARLTVEALGTWRDAHGERYAAEGPGAGLRLDAFSEGVTVEDTYRVIGPGFLPDGEWWRGAYHREEAARGLNPTEDLYRLGTFEAVLDRPGATLEITATANMDAQPAASDTVRAARARGKRLGAALPADPFIIRGPDVVAGYPWFGAWSRDTMIAYEGLFLTTGRVEEGRELLRAYAATLSEGMLANTADTGRTEYNTADATLWFLHAVDRHLAASGDTDLAAELADPLTDVIAKHIEGARYGIRVDRADGLLAQGAAGYALTWMDAVVGGRPVSPRSGKAVDINALWVNGLAAVAGVCERVGRDATQLRQRYEKARSSFRGRFPAPTGWLFDTVSPDDARLRPNQLLAFGLPYAPMGPAPQAVRMIGAALLTPLGLRSLAPGEPGYRGAHRGGPHERDAAYHQGTVWPWLIGPYVDACVRSAVPTDGLLAGLEAHLTEWGLGSVSETADGDPPHGATGCPFQAWSVAELLRARSVIRHAGSH